MTTVRMSSDLVVLLEIQDLQSKLRELEDGSGMGEMEEEEFGIDRSEAATALREKISSMEQDLSEELRARYERVAGNMDRVVVPVIHGTCYGCFTAVPTATAGERDPNASLTTCQHCGRFLYFT